MKYFVKLGLVILAVIFGFWFVGSTLIHDHDIAAKHERENVEESLTYQNTLDEIEEKVKNEGCTYLYFNGEVVGVVYNVIDTYSARNYLCPQYPERYDGKNLVEVSHIENWVVEEIRG